MKTVTGAVEPCLKSLLLLLEIYYRNSVERDWDLHFPGTSAGKESACSADQNLPWVGKIP